MAPYYAVRNGRQTGVYTNWDDCNQQVSGYSNASFKKFDTAEEARAFARGSPSSGNSSSYVLNHSSAGSNGQSGQSSVLHSQSPVYHQSSHGQSSVGYSSHGSRSPGKQSPVGRSGDTVREPNARPSQRYFDFDSHYGVSRNNAAVEHKFKVAEGRPDPNRAIVYTDGSCLGNGATDPAGGYGIHWPAGQQPDRMGPLNGPSHTNQKAELLAVKMALKDAAHMPDPIEIRTDSQYVQKGLCEWSQKWLKNNFEGVQNADLFKEILELGAARKSETFVRYVPAHAGEDGNERADALARQGSRMNKN